MMNPLSPIPAVICLGVAMLTMYLLSRREGAVEVNARFDSIDGLRGYLAFFVFLYHSSIWFFYLRTGGWRAPESNLYTQLGQGSVALFFMITGFLFFTKLINARSAGGVDWFRLFVGRVFRIYPLYLLAGLVRFLIITKLSGGGALGQSYWDVFKGVVNWVTFGFMHLPTAEIDLHGNDASWVLAGVTWTLPYEFFFYFSLPVIGLLLGVLPAILYLFIGLLGLAGLIRLDVSLTYQVFFLGGIIAAMLVRIKWLTEVASHRMVSVALCFVIFLMVWRYSTPCGSIVAFLLLTLIFVLIAAGNDFFGLLTSRFSRALGEISYGIYLLHGALLYCVFGLLIGGGGFLSGEVYWLIVAMLTPVLLVMASVSYRFIELPFISRTGAFVSYIRSVFPFLKSGRWMGRYAERS